MHGLRVETRIIPSFILREGNFLICIPDDKYVFPEAVPGARFFFESQVNRIGSAFRSDIFTYAETLDSYPFLRMLIDQKESWPT